MLTFLANALIKLLRVARYVYLLRVPISIAAILFIFPFAALLQHSPLRALFQNLFLMDDGNAFWPSPTFWSTMAALILAWSILLTSRIVLLNCGDRFNVPSLMTAADLRGWSFFAIVILSLPAILGQFTQQGRLPAGPEGMHGLRPRRRGGRALLIYLGVRCSLVRGSIGAARHTRFGTDFSLPVLHA